MIRRLSALTALAVAATLFAGCSAQTAPAASATASAASADYGLVTPGTLTIATEGTYRPFSFHEGDGSGPLQGFDVEIAKAVADKLGLKPVFKETQWDAIFAGLDADRFDVIANQVSINPERKAKYLFSTPYTVSHGVIVVNADNDAIHSFADLKGKTTAQSLTSNWYQLAKDDGAQVQAVEGWAQAVALVRQHRVDATVNDELTFLDYQKQNKDAGLKAAAETPEASEQAFAFTKSRKALAAAVDVALGALRADGTLKKISEKYFGDDVTK